MTESHGLRERYLAALVAVQQKLLERSAGEYFGDILPILGTAAGADRAYYFDNFQHVDGTLHCQFRTEWCRPGILADSELTGIREIPVERSLPQVVAAMRRGEAITGFRDTVPAALQELMRLTDVQSILLLPVMVGGQFFAFLGFDNCTDRRPWLPEEVDLLRAVAGAVAVYIEREQAKDHLHDALEKLQLHINQTPLAVMEWDRDFRVTMWSRRAEQVFGWSAEELLGKKWSDWQFVYEEDAEKVTRIAASLQEGGTPNSVCFNRNYTKSGDVRWCEWYNSVIRDHDGAVTSTLSLALDVTERVRAEEEVRRTLARSAQTEKMAALGQMSSGIAHDFNNSLTVILGKAELLIARHALSEKIRSTVEEIITAGLDAAATVRRLQQFVRNRPGEPEHDVLELSRLGHEVAGLTRQRWSDHAEGHGATITLATEFCPPARVRADASELRELLTNLIFNSVDAMPRGGKLSLATGIENGRAYLRVSDTGAGMDAETLRRCFEPFFTTKGVNGTGLGLAVSWSIARRYGGELTVQSAPGQGTAFTLWLPAVDATAGTATIVTADEPTGSLRVLIVDDRSDVTAVLGGMFRQLDHRPDAVTTGEEGLRRLTAGDFDLVVTDLGMPDLDGREVARRVKLIDPKMPVVLLTGWAEELRATGEKPPGVDRILAKPVSFNQLRSALAAMFPA